MVELVRQKIHVYGRKNAREHAREVRGAVLLIIFQPHGTQRTAKIIIITLKKRKWIWDNIVPQFVVVSQPLITLVASENGCATRLSARCATIF